MGWSFYKNTIQDNFASATEPTLEAETGTNSAGAAVAAGGVASDALDNKIGKALVIDTSGQTTSPRVDVAMDSRKDIGFVAFLGHNMRKVYEAAVSKALAFYVETDATFSAGTPETITKAYSGFLGKIRPYLGFDGVDDGISGADTAFPTGSADRSVEAWVKFDSVSIDFQTIFLYGAQSSGNAFLLSTDSGSNSNKLVLGRYGGNSGGSTTALVTGTWYHIVVTYQYDGTVEWYLNGASDGSTALASVNTTLTGTWNIGGGSWNANDDFAGEMRGLTFYNRVLPAAEVLDRYKGGEIAPAYLGGNQTELLTNGDMESWASSTNLNDWVETLGGTSTITRDGVDMHGGTYSAKHTIDSSAGQAQLSHFAAPAYTVGKRYHLAFWAKGSTTNQLFVSDDLSGSSGGLAETIVLTTDWVRYSYEFIANAASDTLRFDRKSGAEVSWSFNIDDVSLNQVGAVISYDHDGISEDQGKWLDVANARHGTIFEAEYKLTPSGTDQDFTLLTFDEVNARYLFFQINPDGLTATANNLRLGEVMAGKVFTPISADLGGTDHVADDGIKVFQGDSGPRSSYKTHDGRKGWNAKWSSVSKTEREEWEKFLENSKHFPFLFTPDNRITEGKQPVLYLGRVMSYNFVEIATDFYNLAVTIEQEL